MNDPAWLKEIDAREKAATKGPWCRTGWLVHTVGARSPSDRGGMVGVADCRIPAKNDYGLVGVRPLTTGEGSQEANSCFIAHSRADTPLMHDMLRLLAEELGATACELARIRYLLVGEDQDEVGRRWAAVEAALTHYHDGTLPEKGESDEK